MRLIRVVCCLALAAAPALACENEETQAPAKAAQPQQPSIRSVQERARSLLLAADLQLRDLRDSHEAITDPNKRDAIAGQIAEVSLSRDRLMADLAAGGTDAGLLERDASNLQRAMQGKGAAETQPQSRPQPPPQPQSPQPQPVEPPHD